MSLASRTFCLTRNSRVITMLLAVSSRLKLSPSPSDDQRQFLTEFIELLRVGAPPWTSQTVVEKRGTAMFERTREMVCKPKTALEWDAFKAAGDREISAQLALVVSGPSQWSLPNSSQPTSMILLLIYKCLPWHFTDTLGSSLEVFLGGRLAGPPRVSDHYPETPLNRCPLDFLSP